MKKILAASLLAALAGTALNSLARSGSDEQARAEILEICRDCTPWMTLPALSQVIPEPLLFGLQAALGTAAVGVALLRLRKRS